MSYLRKKVRKLIELRIDPEFRDKIPPMPKEDFEGLKEDILRDGYVRDPLVVWKEENVLMDGHHRWRIIQENKDVLEDKFKIDYKSFPDRWACIAWICANQLHKHNMNEMQRMKLLQEEYEARKNTSSFKGNQYVTSGGEENLHQQNDKAPKLRAEMMKEHNIGSYEMQTAVEVGRGIDRAEEVVPGIKQEILSGELKASKKEIAAIRKLGSDDEVKEAIEEIRNPKPKKEKNPNIEWDADTEDHKVLSHSEKIALSKRIDEVARLVADKEKKHVYTEEDAEEEFEILMNEFVSKIRRVIEVRNDVVKGSKKLKSLLYMFSNELRKLKEEI